MRVSYRARAAPSVARSIAKFGNLPPMRIRYLTVLLAALVTWGCASSVDTDISPQQAVFAGAEHLDGVRGVFRLVVRGGGRQNGWLYINSEADYRDQRCLTVAFPPDLEHQLSENLRADPIVALTGKTIRVNGVARRTTIGLFANGQQTDKYYYQTQVRIDDLSQMTVLP
jgi:hypothetical protein